MRADEYSMKSGIPSRKVAVERQAQQPIEREKVDIVPGPYPAANAGIDFPADRHIHDVVRIDFDHR